MLGKIIEVDGATRDQEIEWEIESLRAVMGGDFRIVHNYKGAHVLEVEFTRGLQQNMTASTMCGMMLHGRILIIKEPKRD